MNSERSATGIHRAALQSLQTIGPLLALLVVIGLFAILDQYWGSKQFASFRNLTTVTAQNCTIVVAALGMTLIIVSGGIDLSCGTAIALSATVLAWGLREDVGCRVLNGGDSFLSLSQRLEKAETADGNNPQLATEKIRERLIRLLEQKQADRGSDALALKIAFLKDAKNRLELTSDWQKNVPNHPWSAPLAFFMGLLTGAMCGWLNGWLISSLRVVPFIVTLGTMTIYLGCGNWLSGNTPIRPSVEQQVPNSLASMVRNLPEDRLLGFPIGVWLTLVVSLLLAGVLRYSVFGRYVFALGSNEQTARLCGMNVGWNKIAVYTLAGLFMGLAGVLQFSRLASGNPMSGRGLELQVIAAVVIGGGSLSGGRGTVLGTVAGAGIMAVIYSGCTQIGLDNATQDIILGIVIIGAVAIDQLRQRMTG